MRRTYVFVGLLWTALLVAIVARLTTAGLARPEGPERAGKSLPLAQVILFSSGVGYFQRAGAVEGSTRIDLSFPATDVNDLIKSLIIEDGGKGKVSAVSYEGQEPLERTLKSFALDLTYNPTFGQILNQARGEKVELTLTAGSAATLNGVIVGMESQPEQGGREVHHLNLLSAEGMRRVPLAQVQRIRFLNAALEAEFRRALEVLAGAHHNQRRHVSLHLKGEGKRDVKVGYVVENPIWKASYRLVLGSKADRPHLRAWAVVENTTDEDWKDVRLVLISARPISYQMDLSQPLFVPRPTVESERFASLRPPLHQGAVVPTPQAGAAPGGLGLQLGGLQFGGGGLQIGVSHPESSPSGGFVFGATGFFNRYQVGPGSPGFAGNGVRTDRLTYEQLRQRRQAKLEKRRAALEEARRLGRALAELGTDVESVVRAESAGDSFRYTLEQKVSLPRQRSALLPILDGGVVATPVSIYNRPCIRTSRCAG
jgi:hypothetical protein